MKAGQQSRHSCNQIPRGRYQHTRVQAGPEHKLDHSRGREGRQDRDRNHNKGGQTTKETTGPAQAQRGAQKTRKTTRRNSRNTKTAHSHEPHRATHARKHKTAKEKEGSTDKACEEQGALDQSKARNEPKTEGRGASSKTRKQETAKRIRGVRVHLSRLRTDTQVQRKLSPKNTLGRMGQQCTCHVYGQIRQ